MGTLEAEINGDIHSWDTIGNLRGWFTQAELDGDAPYPSQAVLDSRECALEEQNENY